MESRSVERVLSALGPVSIFPVLQCACFLLGYLSDAHQMLAYVFTGQDVEHSCAPPANTSSSSEVAPVIGDVRLNSSVMTLGQCVISVVTNVSGDVRQEELPCLYGVDYGTGKDKSIVSEFDLVCERKALAGLTQTLLSLGRGLGAIVCPWLSDLYGRKRVMVIAQFLTLGTSLLSAFAPSYSVFAVTRFLTGLLVSGIGIIGATAALESTTARYRAVVSGVCSCLWWSLCVGSISPIAYAVRFHSWRILQLVLTASCGTVIVMIVMLSEPIHWLVAKGKFTEVERVIKRAAAWSRKDPQTILNVFRSALSSDLQLLKSSQRCAATAAVTDRQVEWWEENTRALNAANGAQQPESGNIKASLKACGQEQHQGEFRAALSQGEQGRRKSRGEEEEEESLPFLALFRHRRMRTNILLSWIVWFVNCLTYDALYLLSGILVLDIYWGFLLNSVVEGAAAVIMATTLNRFGRKKTVGCFHGAAGLALIASGVCFHFKDNHSLQIVGTVFSLCGKMAISGSFNAIFLYTPEIFPTNIRNRALGTSVAAAMLGGMVAPFSGLLADYAVWAPAVVFGTLCLVAMLLLMAMPESMGRELPQNIRDLENWYDVTSDSDLTQKSSPTAAADF
ncbi:organic anion transporter 3-like [Babylonia areolata]|uniref:organic anion transporter 3-like n=1 Tax=Babylonia areolata TaxID=304850 RepID=UPI003FD20DEC